MNINTNSARSQYIAQMDSDIDATTVLPRPNKDADELLPDFLVKRANEDRRRNLRAKRRRAAELASAQESKGHSLSQVGEAPRSRSPLPDFLVDTVHDLQLEPLPCTNNDLMTEMMRRDGVPNNESVAEVTADYKELVESDDEEAFEEHYAEQHSSTATTSRVNSAIHTRRGSELKPWSEEFVPTRPPRSVSEQGPLSRTHPTSRLATRPIHQTFLSVSPPPLQWSIQEGHDVEAASYSPNHSTDAWGPPSYLVTGGPFGQAVQASGGEAGFQSYLSGSFESTSTAATEVHFPGETPDYSSPNHLQGMTSTYSGNSGNPVTIPGVFGPVRVHVDREYWVAPSSEQARREVGTGHSWNRSAPAPTRSFGSQGSSNRPRDMNDPWRR